jgi:hypothetical protein
MDHQESFMESSLVISLDFHVIAEDRDRQVADNTCKVQGIQGDSTVEAVSQPFCVGCSAPSNLHVIAGPRHGRSTLDLRFQALFRLRWGPAEQLKICMYQLCTL